MKNFLRNLSMGLVIALPFSVSANQDIHQNNFINLQSYEQNVYMETTEVYEDVSRETFICSMDKLRHNLTHPPFGLQFSNIVIPEADSGIISFTLVEPKPLKGDFVFGYDFVEPTLTIELLEKPRLIPEELVWGLITVGIDSCR